MRLDVVIPTKGRRDDLIRGLRILSANFLAERPPGLKLGVCVSDSSQDPMPLSVFSDACPELTVKYLHQPTARRFVENLRSAVFLSTADYLWLMGDDDFIMAGALSQLAPLLQKGYSMIHVNSVHRNSIKGTENILIKEEVNSRRTTYDPGGDRSMEELTYMSCLIFDSNILQVQHQWDESKPVEVASHLRFVTSALNQGNCLAIIEPLVVIEKNDDVVAEWNGNWCVLIGYEMPRARDALLRSGRKKAVKLRPTSLLFQELRMHLILSVFRKSFPDLAREAKGFLHENQFICWSKKTIFILTSLATVRYILRKVGSLLDSRCARLR